MMKQLQKIALISILIFPLISCSYLKAVAPLLLEGSKSGLSVSSDIGDKKIDVAGQGGTGDIEVEDDGIVNINNDKSESRIEKANNVMISNVPVWIVVLLSVVCLAISPDYLKSIFSTSNKSKEDDNENS